MNIPLIRNYYIGQELLFGNIKVKIIDFLILKEENEKALINQGGIVSELQFYKVLVNNEIFYISDLALQSKDPNIFTKCIANIGYRGSHIDLSIYQKEYIMWKDMIYRCYNTNNRLYPFYGAIGITVDPRWLCFELFLYNIVNVQNYEKIKSKYSYVLDIKSKQKNIPENQRIYAPGMVSIKQYYQSDIFDNIQKAEAIGAAQEAGSYIDSANTTKTMIKKVVKKEYKRNKNGSYPPEAYTEIIKNPPNLPIPNDDDIGYDKIRMLNGVHYRRKALNSIYPKSQKGVVKK